MLVVKTEESEIIKNKDLDVIRKCIQNQSLARSITVANPTPTLRAHAPSQLLIKMFQNTNIYSFILSEASSFRFAPEPTHSPPPPVDSSCTR